MRNRSYRGVAISLFFVLLLGSVPVAAAPARDGDGLFAREFKVVVRVVKAIGKKVGGIVTFSDGMTPPKP